MMTDEEQIRQLVADWHAASRAGDTDRVLSLMTDDVVFLVPGRPPLLKAEFAALSSVPPGAPRPQMEAQSNLEEIQLCGDWAFLRSYLVVKVTPPGATEAVERAGHTLTILQRVNGRWLLARDANLLVPQKQTQPTPGG